MTHRVSTNCAKNYCNLTIIVKVIVENVVTCFLGHNVVTLYNTLYFYFMTRDADVEHFWSRVLVRVP